MSALRSRVTRFAGQLWFNPKPKAAIRAGGLLLRPLCFITRKKAIRQRARIEQSQRAPDQPDRPTVIIVGNLVAGGAGKTPLTIAIARQLSREGRRVGIICRGDGADRAPAQPVSVRWPDDARRVGDEAVLLARATGLPVVACRHRDRALKAISASDPELDIVLSDDGLQHAALNRHIELAVFGERGIGNGQLLPAGPLREPLEHVARMDAVILNQGLVAPGQSATQSVPAIAHNRRYISRTVLADLVPLNEYLHSAAGTDVSGQEQIGDYGAWLSKHGIRADRPLAAMASIANPEAFFEPLRQMGLTVVAHPRPDHEPLDQGTLNAIDGSQLVMTEKDAVKCRNLNDPRAFVLRIVAQPDPRLIDWLIQQADRLRANKSVEPTVNG